VLPERLFSDQVVITPVDTSPVVFSPVVVLSIEHDAAEESISRVCVPCNTVPSANFHVGYPVTQAS